MEQVERNGGQVEMNIFKEIFSVIGVCTVAMIMVLIIESMRSKIKYWRAHKTKIKCFCKPHVYALHSIWAGEEAEFICTKCGKEKRLIIEPKSFYEFFRKMESEQNEINRCR